MKTSVRSVRPTDRSSWRCVPSPQSIRIRSAPRRTSTAGRPRRALGTEPAVPAKKTENSMPACERSGGGISSTDAARSTQAAIQRP